MNILVLETSTASVKALLYDTAKKEYSVVTKKYEQKLDDVTLLDGEAMFEQLASVCRKITNGSKVDTIVLSSTWHSIALADKKMNLLTPFYLWSNNEASSIAKHLRDDSVGSKEYYKKTGCVPHALYPFFKLQMLRQQFNDFEDILVIGQGDYNTYRLTGEFVMTRCIASGTGMLNIWTEEYDEALLSELKLDYEQLPRLVDSYTSFPLSAEGAKALNLEAGIPVFPSNSDGGLNQLGAGASKAGVMTLSIGTSGALRISTDKPVIPDVLSTWAYLSPDSNLSGAATNGCCNCIDWFVEKMGMKKFSFEALEKEESRRLDSPIFLPFPFGERCPGWKDDNRGGFVHLGSDANFYDFYYAIQEGVLFNLLHCYKILEDLNGEPDHVRLSGGILNSSYWTQMCADIFQKNMEINADKQSSLIGGVILALKANDAVETEVYKELTQVHKIVEPRAENKDYYTERFEQYLEYYKKM